MSEKLKPCPFCGGKAILHKAPEGRFVTVDCINFDCILRSTRYYITEQEAIKAWNRRPNYEPA